MATAERLMRVAVPEPAPLPDDDEPPLGAWASGFRQHAADLPSLLVGPNATPGVASRRLRDLVRSRALEFTDVRDRPERFFAAHSILSEVRQRLPRKPKLGYICNKRLGTLAKLRRNPFPCIHCVGQCSPLRSLPRASGQGSGSGSPSSITFLPAPSWRSAVKVQSQSTRDTYTRPRMMNGNYCILVALQLYTPSATERKQSYKHCVHLLDCSASALLPHQ